MTTDDRRMRWIILAVLFVARVAMSYQFQSPAAIGPVLVRAFDIEYALLGTLVSLYLLPGVFMALPGGLLGQRFGDKRVTLVGLGLMAAGGAVVALGDSFPVAAAGRVASGVGAVLLTILLAKMLTDWFAGREIVFAMALLISSWPAGIGLALIVVPALAGVATTAVALGSASVFAVAAFLLVWAAYRPPAGLPAGSASFRVNLDAREWRLALVSGAMWALYNVAYAGILVFAPSFLVARGLSVAAAGAAISLVTWAVIFTLPSGGFLARRVGSADAVTAGSLLATALAAGALSAGLPPHATAIAIGLLIGPAGGLIMALPSSILKPENRAAGMGVYYTCYYLGMTFLLPVAGALRDRTQDAAIPLLFSAVALTVSAAGLALFRWFQGRPAFASP